VGDEVVVYPSEPGGFVDGNGQITHHLQGESFIGNFVRISLLVFGTGKAKNSDE
jgi:hypothetical protein